MYSLLLSVQTVPPMVIHVIDNFVPFLVYVRVLLMKRISIYVTRIQSSSNT